jgi:hypothetical protein
VNALLKRHLIAAPLAYRLLYNKDLPATSIDSPKHLAQSPGLQEKGWKIDYKALRQKAARAVGADDLPEVQRLSKALEARTDGPEWVRAPEAALGAVQRNAEALAALLLRAAPGEFADEAAELDALAKNTAAYRIAAQRDAIMAGGILAAIKADPGRTHLAFIGNFHTPGILQLLPRNVKVAIFDLRSLRAGAGGAGADFRSFHAARKDRDSYLRDWAGPETGRVAPTPTELPVYRRGLERESQRIREWDTDTRNRIPFSDDLKGSLISDLRATGLFDGAAVEFRRGGPPGKRPPGAVAAFQYDPESGRGAFIVYDAAEARWTDARRAFVRQAAACVMPKSADLAAANLRSVRILPAIDGRLNYTLYDATDGMMYLVEARTPADIAAQLTLPATSAERRARMRLYQLGLLRRTAREAAHG